MPKQVSDTKAANLGVGGCQQSKGGHESEEAIEWIIQGRPDAVFKYEGDGIAAGHPPEEGRSRLWRQHDELRCR